MNENKIIKRTKGIRKREANPADPDNRGSSLSLNEICDTNKTHLIRIEMYCINNMITIGYILASEFLTIDFQLNILSSEIASISNAKKIEATVQKNKRTISLYPVIIAKRGRTKRISKGYRLLK